MSERHPSTAGPSGGLTVLAPADTIHFACHAGLACFTRCCRDVTIFLTPYDILRMKKALGISSGDFLARHTLTLVGDTGLPVVVLKMGGDDRRSCPFVSSAGCAVYADRPWACRIYPLQPESTPAAEKTGKAYYSTLDAPFCRGWDERRQLTVKAWLSGQGVPQYQNMEAPFKQITTAERLTTEKITNPRIRDMVFLAAYDLDRFRRFVLESTFLERFQVPEETVREIRTDDERLYRFALRWLEYGLLARDVLTVKPEVMAAKQRELGIY